MKFFCFIKRFLFPDSIKFYRSLSDKVATYIKFFNKKIFTSMEKKQSSCRIGCTKIFSGLNIFSDFTVHSHQESYNKKFSLSAKLICKTSDQSYNLDDYSLYEYANYGNIGLHIHENFLIIIPDHVLNISTSKVKNPNYKSPSQLSINFFLHKNLRAANHNRIEKNGKKFHKKSQKEGKKKNLYPKNLKKNFIKFHKQINISKSKKNL